MSKEGDASAMRCEISLRRAMRCLAMYLSCDGVSYTLEGKAQETYPPAVHAEDVDKRGVAVSLRGGHDGGQLDAHSKEGRRTKGIWK